MRVTRHYDANPVRSEQCAELHELLIVVGDIMAAGKERVAEHGHHHLAARRFERGAKPRALLGVDASQHAGIHSEQRKGRRLQLKERRVLRARGHPVLAPEEIRSAG